MAFSSSRKLYLAPRLRCLLPLLGSIYRPGSSSPVHSTPHTARLNTQEAKTVFQLARYSRVRHRPGTWKGPTNIFLTDGWLHGYGPQHAQRVTLQDRIREDARNETQVLCGRGRGEVGVVWCQEKQ